MNYKNILLISSEFPPGPGGIGNHAFSLAKSLAKVGNKVFVVSDADYTNSKDVELFDRIIPTNIFISRVFRNGVKTYINRVKQTLKILKNEEIDVVILSGKFSLWVGGIVHFLGVQFKSIAILHGSEVKISKWFWRKLTLSCIGKVDFLVPVSSFTHRLLPIKLQKKDFEIIENGIDIDEMSKLNSDHSDLMLKGKPSLLTVGNVTYRKGQHRVIKALPKLIEKYPEVHYHIVGLPTYKDEFRHLAQTLNVQDYVTFHGRLRHRTDLGRAYSQADCFMILSENQPNGDVEGFGIVILESNYFGVPVVGATGCGISDAIEDGYNGYLVDGDNANEITNALSKIVSNENQMSENALKWSHKHDWNNIVTKYINIINSLIEK